MSKSKPKGPIKSAESYVVGYGKPPLHSQFKPGQSGNPKGRPKGALSLAAALNKSLRARVVIVENGRRRTITMLEAAVKGLVNRAVKGDPRAMQQMLGLSPLVGMEAVENTSSLDAHDAAILASLVARLGSSSEETS